MVEDVYAVTLTVKDQAGIDSVSYSDHLSVEPAPPLLYGVYLPLVVRNGQLPYACFGSILETTRR